MEKSISWLEKLLTLQGLEASVSGQETTGDLGDDSYWLTIDTANLSEEDISTLIGDRGSVLDSIQYLANTTLNLWASAYELLANSIEIYGYRKARQSELKKLADEAADEVLNNGKREYEVKGLSSAERRQLHGLLGEHENIETFSRGREPERHLVVKLVTEASATDESE